MIEAAASRATPPTAEQRQAADCVISTADSPLLDSEGKPLPDDRQQQGCRPHHLTRTAASGQR
jgi:hypothetical protein